MAKAWDAVLAHRSGKPLDWRKRMSDNVAYALLVYTALQIFVTLGTMHGKGGSMLPYFVLVILVAAIIPACRRFEKRWARLTDAQAADHQFARYYWRDFAWLWLLAAGLPFVVAGIFVGLGKLFT